MRHDPEGSPHLVNGELLDETVVDSRIGEDAKIPLERILAVPQT